MATDKAISEKRRVYIGNLKYQVQPKDLMTFFAHCKDEIENLQISMDKMTGRNPSYCFLDIKRPAFVQTFIDQYQGKLLLDRPVKIKLNEEGRSAKRFTDTEQRKGVYPDRSTAFSSRWKILAPESNAKNEYCPSTRYQMGREEGTRLYIGGLPLFDDHQVTERNIRDLFTGFSVKYVSKLITPPSARRVDTSGFCYCFVDMADSGEAQRAIEAIHGTYRWKSPIRVSRANGESRKLYERQSIYVGGFSDSDSLGPVPSSLSNTITPLLAHYGAIKILTPRLLRDPISSMWYCLVQFSSDTGADSAIRELNNTLFLGVPLIVKFADEVKRRT